MGQFVLTWSNANEVSNPNVTSQRASHQPRTAQPGWATDGFNPANDLAKTATTTTKTNGLDNIVYQFKIEAICSVGGPVGNDNGIQEAINFVCVDGSFSVSSTTYDTITVSASGLSVDITKVGFYLRLHSSATNITTSVQNVSSGNITAFQFTGLNGSTSYDIWYEMHATVKGVDVVSSVAGQVGALCGPKTISTLPTPTCAAPSGLSVVAS